MSHGRRRPVLTLAILAVVLVSVPLALVVLGGGAAIAQGEADDGGGVSGSADSVRPRRVAPGRPCADPIESQGFRPGPGAFEPNHTGIDFICMGDHTLVDVLPGTIVEVQTSDCPNTLAEGRMSFGCDVVVETRLAGRDVFVRYAHAAEGSVVVAVGQTVVSGTPLATEGSTGFSTGPHVHFEVDVGRPASANAVDPAAVLDPAVLR